MGKYLLAIDQGTSSTRSVLYDDKGKFIDSSQLEFKQYFPKEGWVEHNPEEIWESVINCLSLVDSEFDLSQLDSIGTVSYTHLTLPTICSV